MFSEDTNALQIKPRILKYNTIGDKYDVIFLFLLELFAKKR